MSKFLKILTVGAELFHAEGLMSTRRDMTKLGAAFRSFAFLNRDFFFN
jgi:hypothetical protein